MTGKWTLRAFVVFVAAALFASAAAAGDILSDYQSKYQKASFDSAREDVVKEIAATGKPEALKALQWCQGAAKQALDEARKESDKAHAKLVPIRDKYEARMHEWVDDEKKHGRVPDVTRPPKFPEYDEFLQANADVENAEKRVVVSQALISTILDLHGECLAKLAPDAQKVVREEWTKTRLNSKDWGVRAELYEILGHAPLEWAVEILAAAVQGPDGTEHDPRALVLAVDGLAGRDAAKVTPVLVSRIDDVRWLVRAAVVAALENTPSKEGIDAVVKRMQKEDGRLKGDCARALKALTGKDLPANPEVWRVWWESNREKWTGKPPAPDPNAPLTPFAEADKKDAPSERKTGFFGIEIESKRVVFVIDVSGSMTWEMGGKGPEAKMARAPCAKEELKRCIGGLEDGTLFDIIFFSTSVHVWKADMQKADAKIRGEARAYVDSAEVMGATNTYDALEAAFALGDMGKGKKRESDPTGDARMDTIVFLSDGKPTLGRITDPDKIRSAVRDWNKARRIAIHSIAFGVSAGPSKDREGADPVFMKGLATDSGGKYVEK
jgi:hypothetical protein